MAYITSAEYISRFGQNEYDELLASSPGISFDVIAADASAVIDSYLAGSPSRTSTLPLDPVPPRVVELAAEITRYKLWGARASEQVETRHTAAIEYLERISGGDSAIPGETEATSAAPKFTAKDREFTDDNLSWYVGERNHYIR